MPSTKSQTLGKALCFLPYPAAHYSHTLTHSPTHTRTPDHPPRCRSATHHPAPLDCPPPPGCHPRSRAATLRRRTAAPHCRAPPSRAAAAGPRHPSAPAQLSAPDATPSPPARLSAITAAEHARRLPVLLPPAPPPPIPARPPATLLLAGPGMASRGGRSGKLLPDSQLSPPSSSLGER